jgi:hypothetical protein
MTKKHGGGILSARSPSRKYPRSSLHAIFANSCRSVPYPSVTCRAKIQKPHRQSAKTGYHHLVNVAQWHVSDDNYVAARAAVVNAHHKHPMAAIWDDGTTASSDGRYFRAGGRASGGGAINAKYGIDPGFVFYTHVSGRYSPFHTQVIAATVSEAPYVLDGPDASRAPDRSAHP